MVNNSKKTGGMGYNAMRKEIQDQIISTLKAADKIFKDVKLDKLKALIKFDYGIGELTVNRIIDNLVILEMVEIKGDLIQTKINKVAKKGSNGG